MTLSEYLTAAREILNRGWIKGALENADGCCILWALNYVSWHRTDRPELLDKARDAVDHKIRELCPELSKLPSTIATFNDTPGRTKDEVLNIFDIAIHSAQEHGE